MPEREYQPAQLTELPGETFEDIFQAPLEEPDIPAAVSPQETTTNSTIMGEQGTGSSGGRDEEHGYVQKSSVKISQTAKGDPRAEVKVIDGTTEAAMHELRRLAVDTYKQMQEDLG